MDELPRFRVLGSFEALKPDGGAIEFSHRKVRALLVYLAVEHGPSNVRVNCIAPGLVKTDFARALWEDEKMLEDIWESAQKMESRINTLETILDDQVPDWRKRT